MKCVVCGKKYSEQACPVCKFPVIRFPGDPEEGMRSMKPGIDAYRDNFLKNLRVALVTYSWKDKDGSVVLDKRQELPFGTGTEMYGKEVWLSKEFARIQEKKNLQIQIVVHTETESMERQITLDNLMEPELQKIGAGLDEDMNFWLMLKNATGETRSPKEPLFL